MATIVEIFDKKSGKRIGSWPIILQNTQPITDQDYFDEAWKCAIEDRVVPPNANKGDFVFKLIQQPAE